MHFFTQKTLLILNCKMLLQQSSFNRKKSPNCIKQQQLQSPQHPRLSCLAGKRFWEEQLNPSAPSKGHKEGMNWYLLDMSFLGMEIIRRGVCLGRESSQHSRALQQQGQTERERNTREDLWKTCQKKTRLFPAPSGLHLHWSRRRNGTCKKCRQKKRRRSAGDAG